MQPLKERLIEKTALQLQVESELADTVVSWVYEKANKATQVHAEIELSGFGKLLISQSKVKHRLKRYEGILTGTSRMLSEAPSDRIDALTKRVHTVTESITTLQSRIIPQ